MRKWWINGLAVLMAGALTVFAVGCGDDDDEPTGMTLEEQYDAASAYLLAAPSLMLSQLGTNFLDGVEESDFQVSFFGLGKMVSRPGLGKVKVIANEISLEYTAGGWWVYHADFELDSLGNHLEFIVDDSVRFETAGGVPQMIPDESTANLLHEGEFFFDVAITDESIGSIALELSGDNDFVAIGLEADSVTFDGSASGVAEVHADDVPTEDEGTIDLELLTEFSAEVNGLTAANSPGACPESGTIEMELSMDVGVVDDNGSQQAQGDWTASIELLGDGAAHAEFHSGDFDVEEDIEDICPQE